MALKQSLSQKLDLRLSPQQIQLMKLLEVPTVELDMRIKQEIEENPALDEGKEDYEDDFEAPEDYDEYEQNSDERDDFDLNDYLDDDEPTYKTTINNKGKDDDDRVIPLSSGNTFQERLISQLNLNDISEKQKLLATYLIGNLDDAGYLERELEAIVDDLAFSQNITADEAELEAVLKIIQDLEPAGIGARDLKECLLIQIRRKQNGNITRYTAMKILENHFEEFTKKHYEKIISKLEIEDDDLRAAINEIIRLNPKPGGSLKEASKSMIQIIPDFEIREIDGELELSINGRNAPDLKVSKSYEKMLRNYAEGAQTNKADKEAMVFVKQKLDSAKWFIDALKQRQATLYGTMNAIMNYQKEYFLTGDETKLKPMILKDIAEVVGLDISTISRAANSKYVQTPYGVFILKHFFSEGMEGTDGEEVSTREIKAILVESIEQEDKRKPLTDEKLVVVLKEKGFALARRTIAKYREQLNIPVARMRKEI